MGLMLPLTGRVWAAPMDLAFDFKFGKPLVRNQAGTNHPSGVALNADTGDVFVMDLLNNRVKRYDAAGNLVTQWICRQGLGLTVDPRTDIVWVAMKRNHTVRAYSPDGTLLITLGNEGKPGTGPAEFKSPSDVSIDPSSGNLYVMDSGNQRVQVFRTDLSTPQAAIVSPERIEGRGRRAVTIPAEIDWEPFWLAVYIQNFEGDLTELPKTGGIERFSPETMANLDAIQSEIQPKDYTPTVQFSHEFTVGDTEKSSQFQQPFGISVHPGGDFLVVANTGNHELIQFDLDGQVLARWPRPSTQESAASTTGVPPSSEPGVFHWPRNVAIDASGNIYVADTRNERIQKLDTNGQFLSFIMGPNDRASGSFHPRAVDVNPQTGAIVATASYANRIDRFDADGQFVASFGVRDRTGHRLNTAKGLAIHPESGDIYISDSMDHRIRRFDSEGRFLDDFDMWIPEQHNTQGEPLDAEWFTDPTRVMWTVKEDQSSPSAMDFDADGRLWMSRGSMRFKQDPRLESSLVIRSFDAEGVYQEGFGHSGFPNNGRMRGLLVDRSQKHIYIANSINHVLMKFHLDGTHIWTVGKKGNGTDQFHFPSGLSMDPETGRLFVVDSRNGRIQILNTDGEFLGHWGEPGDDDGQFQFTDFSGLSWAPEGYLFIADSKNHRVQVLDTDGQFVMKHGEKGFGGIGKYTGFTDLIAHNGKLYILDNAGAEVEVYNISFPDETSSDD